jgi:gephyrin
MGELDLLKPTIERALGGTIHFGRVSMKPGKPTTFATVRVKDNSGNERTKLIFSLPGNPASAITCVNLFVLPCLAKASGHQLSLVGQLNSSGSNNAWKQVGAPRIQVVAMESVRCDKSREEYQRAVVVPGDDGRFFASVTGGQRSSRIGSFQSANALLVLPAGGVVEKGELVEALLIGSL